MNFGKALEILKHSGAVQRAGWNGKGMFVYLVPANAYPAQTGVAKAFFGEGALVPYGAYLALKGVDGTVNTWVPSISDVLAEDWHPTEDSVVVNVVEPQPRVDNAHVAPGCEQFSDADIEREIQAKGKTAPRITPDDIESNIVDMEIVKHASNTGQVLRWAILTTQSGFAVVGKPSVAVSSANDDQEIGEKIALDNSYDELWPLMGYALKQRLHDQAAPVA